MMVDSQVASAGSDRQMAIVVSLSASAHDSGAERSVRMDDDCQGYEQCKSSASL